jgi:hypothetical protein
VLDGRGSQYFVALYGSLEQLERRAHSGPIAGGFRPVAAAARQT